MPREGIQCMRCHGEGAIRAAGANHPRKCPSCLGAGWDDGLTEQEREIAGLKYTIRELEDRLRRAEGRHV
jgi:DnaJ-class molecular chaperone